MLDLGGGYGDFADILRRNGHDVTVGDVAGGDVYADAEAQLPFPDEAFDAVVCLAVAEHVANWRGLLSELKRVSRCVVLTTPSPAAHPVLWVMARLGMVPADHIADHKHYLRKRELLEAGFRHRYFVFGLNQIATRGLP